jgi:hypothetical protein
MSFHTAIATFGAAGASRVAVAIVSSPELGTTDHHLWLTELDPATGDTVRELRLPDADLAPALAADRDGLLVAYGHPWGSLLALDGNLQTRWDRRLGGRAWAVASDARGIYVAGQFLGTIEWGDHSARTADGYGDPFAGGLTHDGKPTWLTPARGKGVGYASGLAVAGGRVWITGAYDQRLTFLGAPEPLPEQGDGIQSGFVVALEPRR